MMNEWIISSSVLIAAVLLGRFLLRGKISLRLQYALWGIVLLRLLLPFQIFTSPFGTGAMSEQVDLAAPVRQVYHSAYEDRYEQAYDTAYREVKHSIAIAYPDPIVIEQAARELKICRDAVLEIAELTQEALAESSPEKARMVEPLEEVAPFSAHALGATPVDLPRR